jgi:hypothetical protein
MKTEDKYSFGAYLIGLVLFTIGFFKLPDERNWIKWIPLAFSLISVFFMFEDRLEKTSSKIKLYFLIPAFLGLFLFLYFIKIESSDKSKLLVFHNYLERYISVIDSINYANSANISNRNYAGSILPIDIEEKEIDVSTYFHLPKQLISIDPNDVKILVFIKRGSEVVGKYNDGSEAIKNNCNIKIVDLTTKQVLSEETIFGGDPPKTKRRGSGTIVGSDPDIVNFITKFLTNNE